MNSPYGQIAWWGFSPSLDLIDYLKKNEVEGSNELNVLLVGTADGRHLLNTISQLNHFTGTINFFLEEYSLENIARQVLLINLALESPVVYNTQEKAEMYLELFGNTLVRSDTKKYLVERSNDFIKMITDPSYAKEYYPQLDFTNLKFKERDHLEGIFKFWRNEDQEIFNVQNLWENRVRHFLGTRYDTRESAFDWEYSMNLKEKASIVGWHEYKRWRETGLAFVIRDESIYEASNKTLASGLIFKKDGERIPKRGYWGDIMNSPYLAFGIKSKNIGLFEKANKIHVKTSTDVSLYNVSSFLHQLTTGEEYVSNEGENGATIIEEVIENEDVLEESGGCKKLNKNIGKFKIVFLPLESVSSLHKKSKYKRRFDMISLSNSMVHYLDNTFADLFRDKESLLVIESTKFMLDLKPELHEEYGKKIIGLAGAAKCELCKTFITEKDEYAVFKYQGE